MKKFILIIVLLLPFKSYSQGDIYPIETTFGGGIGFSVMILNLNELPGEEIITRMGLDVDKIDYNRMTFFGGEGFAQMSGPWRLGGYAGFGSVQTSNVFDIYYYEPKNLSFNNGKVLAKCVKIQVSNNQINPIKKIKKVDLNLLKVKVLLIRNEPPFDQQYINTTFMLDQISNKIKIVNNPKSIRDVHEKLFSLKFIKYMPPTLISENSDEIKSFIQKYKKIVIKPVEGYGGSDVSLIKKFKKKIINKYFKKYNHVVIQKFLGEISKGDKRIFIINGKIKGAISRIPKKGSFLSNMSKGAEPKRINVNTKELRISKIIAKELKKIIFTLLE